MQLSDKIDITPFARILPFFAAGILAFRYVTAPDWLIVAAAVIGYAVAWRQRKGSCRWWTVAVALFFSGILVTAVSARKEAMPRGERLAMVLEVGQNPVSNGRWRQTVARVGAYRPLDSAGSGWRGVDEKVELRVDTAERIAVGEQLYVVGYLNPVDTAGSRYGTLMRSRGIGARVYVRGDQVISRLPGNGRRATRYAAALQRWAVERIHRLHVGEREQELLSALIAGDKRNLDRRLKADYSKTGVAHILAVSGLHMGFVLVIANLLFGWTVLLRYGHVAKNVLVISALWFYAVMAGLSPSAVRAALMLSAAQLALACSVPGNGYNVVLGAATLMLAANPFYLYDLSFQLSFMAVLSILFFYPRLYRRKLCRNRIADAVCSSVLLGAAAQIGTLPLVAWNFGNIHIISLIINPLVILTAFLSVFTGILWVLFAFPGLNAVFSAVAGALLQAQNGIVTWAAGTPVASVSGVRFDGYGAAAAYVVLAALAVGLKWREDSRKEYFGGVAR